MLPTSRRTLLKSAAASALTGAVAGVAASAQPRDAVAQAADEDAPPPSTSTGKRAMATPPFVKVRLKRMRDAMAGYVSRGEVPGIVTLLHRRGETQVEAVGKLAVDGAPVQRNSIFRVASMSKPVTAVGAMILVEECKVRLDDPVDPFLPELANRHVLKRIDGPLTDTVPAKRPITLRDLLTFRFGFGQLMAPPESAPVLKAAWDAKIGMGPPQPQAMPAMDEWLRRFGALPLMHQPGEAWKYHTGSDVLGALIARVSGQPFETFLHERIFAPLGMKDTAFSVPPKDIGRFATCYWTNYRTGQIEVYDPAVGGQWSRPPAFPSGGGGLVSTVDDFLAFGQMLLNTGVLGKTRILSRHAVEVMTTNHLTVEQKATTGIFLPDNRGWGFGMAVIERQENVHESVGKFGWDGGLGTSFYVDPKEQLVGVLLTQQSWTAPVPPKVWQDFWTTAYQAID